MATIFSGNAYAYNRSLHQYKQTGTSGTQEQVDLNKFQKLYSNALITLQTDITNFGTNRFDNLTGFNYNNYIVSLNISSFNADNYNTAEIRNLDGYSYDSTTFVKYRNLFSNVLRGLQNGINLNNDNIRLTNANASQAATIQDLQTVPLQQYIGTQNMTNIYADATVNIQATELLPWYSEYLFQYGPPSGGFNTGLLAMIVDTQIRKGLYTIEYFLTANKNVSL